MFISFTTAAIALWCVLFLVIYGYVERIKSDDKMRAYIADGRAEMRRSFREMKRNSREHREHMVTLEKSIQDSKDDAKRARRDWLYEFRELRRLSRDMHQTMLETRQTTLDIRQSLLDIGIRLDRIDERLDEA